MRTEGGRGEGWGVRRGSEGGRGNVWNERVMEEERWGGIERVEKKEKGNRREKHLKTLFKHSQMMKPTPYNRCNNMSWTFTEHLLVPLQLSSRHYPLVAFSAGPLSEGHILT